MREYALVEGFTSGQEFSEPKWLEAIAARNYHTPQYGEVPVTMETLQRMVKNFKEGIRGQEIATNYDHGVDVAKGNKASGWYRDFKIEPSSDGQGMSLYTLVEFTEEAQKEIASGEWKYFSLEWDDWMDNSGNVHQDVVVGGAITNRPVAKHMAALPVNFSETQWKELDEETKKEFAVWSTAFVNTLPDSAFLYIQPGGTKDSEGKTEPRTNRHFPFKSTDGKVDLPHLRNAIARIPQAGSWLSMSEKSRLQNRARAMLSAATRKMAETADADDTAVAQILKELQALLTKAEASDKPKIQRAMTLLSGMEVNMSELVDIVGAVFDESKEWEHSEPGTGSPPTPRTDEDGSDDPAIGGGWRRDPLPLDPNDPHAPHSNGGNVMELTEDQIKELVSKLDLPENATVEQLLETAGKSFSEAKSLREAVKNVDEETKFAENYPTMFAEHQKMKKEGAANRAKSFSESVARVTKTEGDKQIGTEQGLSTLAKEKVESLHQKFSEGTANVADFEDVMTTIMHGGFVKFAEVGSTVPKTESLTDTSTANGVQSARMQFAEMVSSIMKEDEVDLMTATKLAAQRDPELAKAYRATAAA